MCNLVFQEQMVISPPEHFFLIEIQIDPRQQKDGFYFLAHSTKVPVFDWGLEDINVYSYLLKVILIAIILYFFKLFVFLVLFCVSPSAASSDFSLSSLTHPTPLSPKFCFQCGEDELFQSAHIMGKGSFSFNSIRQFCCAQ